MESWLRRHDGLVLALAAVLLVALAWAVAPHVDNSDWPFPKSLVLFDDEITRAKIAGAIRLLALGAGAGLVGLGHARLAKGFGRSVFTVSGVIALALWAVGLVCRLALTEDFDLGDSSATIQLLDSLARVAATAALVPAGTALVAFGFQPSRHDQGAGVEWLWGFSLPGVAVVLTGLSLALSPGTRELVPLRPAGGVATTGWVVVLAMAVAVGLWLAELARPDEGRPRPSAHETITYDLGEWSDGQRRALELLLTGAGVPYGWDGFDLTVPQSTEATVDGLIDEVEAADEESRPS